MNAGKISLADILIGIAYHLPKGNRSYQHDSKKFHRFFYEQRKTHPEMFKEMRFDSDGRYPESRDLNESVETLFVSGIVSWNSNNPFRYVFDEECCEYCFAHYMKDLPEELLLKGIKAVPPSFLTKIKFDLAE